MADLKTSFHAEDNTLIGSQTHLGTEDANPKAATDEEKKTAAADYAKLKTKLKPDEFAKITKVKIGEAEVPVKDLVGSPAPATPPPATIPPAPPPPPAGGQTSAATATAQSKPLAIKIDPDVTAPSPDEETKLGSGVSALVGIQGGGFPASGENPHHGGVARLFAGASIPLISGEGVPLILSLDPAVLAEISSYDMDFETPGGQTGHSGAFVPAGGAQLMLSLRPSVWDFRLRFSAGLRFAVGSHLANDATEATPTAAKDCTAENGYRPGECSNTSPRKLYTGLDGWYDPTREAARPSSGAVVKLGVPVRAEVDVVQALWGSLALGLEYAPTHDWFPKTSVAKDAEGVKQTNHELSILATFRFGGTDARVEKAPTPITVAKPKDSDGDGVEDGKDYYPHNKECSEKDKCPPVKDQDGDGVADAKDTCADTPAGTKVDATGCPVPVTPVYEAVVISAPDSVRPKSKFKIGVKVNAESQVTVQFQDEKGDKTNAAEQPTVKAGEGVTNLEFGVPTSLTSAKYKLIVTIKDVKTNEEKVDETRTVVVVENVTATIQGSFAPNQTPVIPDAKVDGVDKLEGVTYEIVAYDKSNVQTGSVVVKTPVTLRKTRGTFIRLEAPGGKFQKDTRYVVSLRNKDGLEVWPGEFVIGEAPPPPPAPRGGRPTRRRP